MSAPTYPAIFGELRDLRGTHGRSGGLSLAEAARGFATEAGK